MDGQPKQNWTNAEVCAENGTNISVKEQAADTKRENWGNKLEFIVTLIGFCVGLGNVWRFPYLVFRNGGGAFLIPYFLMLLLCGLPLFCLEVALGQFASLGPVKIWRISPIFKGVGFASVIVGASIALYYNVLVSWLIYYFIASMGTSLPWVSCDNEWNTPACYDPSDNSTYHAGMREGFGLDNMGTLQWKLALPLVVSWLIVFLVLLKGIGSLGKVSYFTSLFPYIMMTVMLVRGVTLPGSLEGIKYYLTPDWNKLGEAQVWGDAATQIFYSLGCCMAVLVSMSSYNEFHNNIIRDAMMIPIINCLTSFYCGFVIFATLGYMAHAKGVEVKDVVASGPGLVFVVYPEGLAQMPAAPVWSVLFFLMMTTLGFSSQFSQVEGSMAPIMDEFPGIFRVGRGPLLFRTAFILGFLLLGLPMVTQGGSTLLNLLDVYSGGYPLIIIGLIELTAIGYIYGIRRWKSDITMMVGSNKTCALRVFSAMWCLISPALLVFTFIFKASQESGPSLEGYTYSTLGNVLAILIGGFPIATIIILFLYRFLKDFSQNKMAFSCQKILEVLKKGVTPTLSWGPALPENRTDRYADSITTVEDKYSPPKKISATEAHTGETESYVNPGFEHDVISSRL